MINIEEQIKIAKVLDKTNNLINKRKTQIEELDNLIQSIFYDMFGEPLVTTKYAHIVFDDIIEILTDYHANGSYKILSENVELLDKKNYALMVRTTDLKSNNYNTNVKYLTKQAYDFLEKSKVFGGEIIINKIGSAGKVFLMPELNRPVSLGMNQFLVRVNEKANNKFVFYMLKTPSIEKEIYSKIQGAVTKTITKEAVRSIPLILPSKEKQNEFVSKLIKIEEKKLLLEQSLDQLELTYKSLMRKAFNGTLFQ